MGSVPLETVLAGAEAVRAAVEGTVARNRIVVCDAVTDDDIVIAAALGKCLSLCWLLTQTPSPQNLPP